VAIVWPCLFLLISFSCSGSCTFSLLTFPSLSISLSIICSFPWAISSHVALSSTLKTSSFLLALFLFVFSYSVLFVPIREVGSFSNHCCIHIHGIGILSHHSVHTLFPLSVLSGAQVITSTGSEAGEYEASPLYFLSCGSLPLVNPYWQGVLLEDSSMYSFSQTLFEHFDASMGCSVPPCSG